MTLPEVRRFALALPEATEEPHFDLTSIRVRRKIFATAPPNGETLHIFVSKEDRIAALAQAPDYLEELHWGQKTAGLRVFLPSAAPAVVEHLLKLSWTRRAPKKLLAPDA